MFGMIELWLSWFFLFVGAIKNEPILIVAAAAFAIAGQIALSRKDNK